MKISIKITEKDRQAASHYQSTTLCLIGTALKRRRHKNVIVGGFGVWIDGEYYAGNNNVTKFIAENQDRDAIRAPFYLPSVVGLKLVLTK